ncbi:MAG: hypothetical protein ACRD3W_08145, partial [Terriglobales bacterium]
SIFSLSCICAVSVYLGVGIGGVYLLSMIGRCGSPCLAVAESQTYRRFDGKPIDGRHTEIKLRDGKLVDQDAEQDALQLYVFGHKNVEQKLAEKHSPAE